MMERDNSMVAGPRRPWAMAVAAAIGVTLLAVATRNMIDHVPLYDELLHVLAARGVLETGEPVIGDGAYRRSELFTRVVALSFASLGQSLVAARVPALLAAAALVALVGAWVARRIGLFAGIAAAAILASAPETIQLSVLARFYTLHALAVAVGFIAAYEAAIPGRRPPAKLALVILALIALAVALHLQLTTVVAAAACLAGLLAVSAQDHWSRVREWAMTRSRAFLAGALLAVIVGSVVLWQIGALMLERLGPPPLWSRGRADRASYYLESMAGSMPLLWPLLPLAALATFQLNRRLAVFCATVLISALVVHSLAPFKATRYIYYLLPVMAVLWGGGLIFVAGWIARALQRARPAARPAVSIAIAFLVVGLLLVNSELGFRTSRLVLGKARQIDILPYATEGDWVGASVVLKPMVADSQRIVVSSGVKALHALGRFDYELNPSVVPETESGTEFGLDRRTGRRAIGTADSLALLLDEPGRTLVVADAEKVGVPSGITPAVLKLIAARCSPVAVPEETRVVAWQCGPAERQSQVRLSEH